LALLAALMITAFRCGGPQSIADRAPTVPGGAVSGALALGAVTVLLGALTANLDAGPACQGFPLCNGLVWPLGENSGLARIHWIHRLLAFGLAGHLIGLWIGARRRGRSSTPLTLAAILTVGQLVVAAAMVLTFLQPEWRAIHVAVGTGIWAALVWLRWGDQASGTPASRVKQ
ncbi:MAG: COX15/CtaA family protein, partial [Gemmatimonadales bacterium]